MQKNTNEAYYTFNGENNLERTDVPLAVNCCGFQIGLSDKSERRRIRRDYYLIYITEGDFRAEIGGESFSMGPGNFICVPPNTYYGYTSPEKSKIRYYWIHFTGSAAKWMLRGLETDTLSSRYSANTPLTMRLYEALFSEFRARRKNSDYRAAFALQNILLHLCEPGDSEVGTYLLDKSIRYIHSHLGEKLCVGDLAAMEYMSEGYYRKLFKLATSTSPSDYIAKQRINLALDLLSRGEKDIDSISESIGFDDRLYFQRFFKKHTGYTPAKYRDSLYKS